MAKFGFFINFKNSDKMALQSHFIKFNFCIFLLFLRLYFSYFALLCDYSMKFILNLEKELERQKYNFIYIVIYNNFNIIKHPVNEF